ncbi:mCG141884, partial [Mus musculus]
LNPGVCVHRGISKKTINNSGDTQQHGDHIITYFLTWAIWPQVYFWTLLITAFCYWFHITNGETES